MTQETIDRLIQEIGDWSTRCFKDKQASDLGIVEEIGELVHCILKRYQGIRGYDSPVKFNAEVQDAFGDIGVYMLNHAGYHHIQFHEINFQRWPNASDRLYAAHIMRHAANLMIYNNQRINGESVNRAMEKEAMSHIWTLAQAWAAEFGMDFDYTVVAAWQVVKQRAWDKDRANADKVVTQNEPGGLQVPGAPGLPNTDHEEGWTFGS